MPGKTIPETIKKLIIEAEQNGEEYRDIAHRYHVGIGSVSRVVRRWKEQRTVKRKKGSAKEDNTQTSPTPRSTSQEGLIHDRR